MRRGEPAITLGRAEWSWLPQIPHLLCTDLNELLLIYFKREGTKGFSLGRGNSQAAYQVRHREMGGEGRYL